MEEFLPVSEVLLSLSVLEGVLVSLLVSVVVVPVEGFVGEGVAVIMVAGRLMVGIVTLFLPELVLGEISK